MKFSVNLRVFKGGERVFTPHKELCSTGDYRSGMAYVEETFAAGDYTIVASTFDPGCEGSFKLCVEAGDSPIQIHDIPQEGEGMVSQKILGHWIEGVSAVGNGTYGLPFSANPRFKVILSRETRLTVRLNGLFEPVPSCLLCIYQAAEGRGKHYQSNLYDCFVLVNTLSRTAIMLCERESRQWF